MMQASARKVQDARAEENKTPTEQDNAKMLQQAGAMADTGVKAAMVVTAPNYIAMGVIVATDAGAVQVAKNVVKGVKNVNEELVRPAGQRAGAMIESRVPGGVKAATDYARGVPQS